MSLPTETAIVDPKFLAHGTANDTLRQLAAERKARLAAKRLPPQGAGRTAVQQTFAEQVSVSKPDMTNATGPADLHHMLQYFNLASTEISDEDILASIKGAVKASPSGVKKQTGMGDYPLHTALKQRAPEAVLFFLLEAYPEIAAKTDGYGDLPLSLAVGMHAPVKFCEALSKITKTPPACANLTS